MLPVAIPLGVQTSRSSSGKVLECSLYIHILTSNSVQTTKSENTTGSIRAPYHGADLSFAAALLIASVLIDTVQADQPAN